MRRKDQVSKDNRYGLLTRYRQATLDKGLRENRLIDTLEKPGPQFLVDMKAAVHSSGREFLNRGHGSSLRLCAFA